MNDPKGVDERRLTGVEELLADLAERLSEKTETIEFVSGLVFGLIALTVVIAVTNGNL